MNPPVTPENRDEFGARHPAESERGNECGGGSIRVKLLPLRLEDALYDAIRGPVKGAAVMIGDALHLPD